MIQPGTVHALMGPNGSGKSSLAMSIMGYPGYEIKSGMILFKDEDITHDGPHERSKKGIFLAFQQPLAIPGLTVFQFLKEIYDATDQEKLDVEKVEQKFITYLQSVGLHQSFLYRACNDNFSGGEKKRFEIVQMLVLQPRFIILDEIDSGLDIDALRLIGNVIKDYLQQRADASCLIITHYNKMLKYLIPDYVHLMQQGTIVKTGDISLANQIENQGYDVKNV
jgi:Fe-S cluster assembly ATP-binding protein